MDEKIIIDEIKDLNRLRELLLDDTKNIRIRMEILFQLRSFASLESIKILEEALMKEKSSDLLRHEVCYCLGQMTQTEENKNEITNFLNQEVFSDPKKYTPIVLHEAAEALGNINFDNNRILLQRFLNSEHEIIQETCEIAVENLNWMNRTNSGETEGLNKIDLVYKTNDPAPPFNFKLLPEYADLKNLERILHDTKETIFNRYRVIFTLRELNNEAASKVLSQCYDKSSKGKFSALFKHEVSFIIGQMCENAKSCIQVLENVLQDEDENEIVRHETALALGDICQSKELL
jgi:deoxyhypusine monooxygenase